MKTKKFELPSDVVEVKTKGKMVEISLNLTNKQITEIFGKRTVGKKDKKIRKQLNKAIGKLNDAATKMLRVADQVTSKLDNLEERQAA